MFVSQALWRGYALRKKNNCTKIIAIRRSLQALSGEVREEDKLYKRTALALFHLLTYKHLSAVLEALKHLGACPCAHRSYLRSRSTSAPGTGRARGPCGRAGASCG